MARYSIWVLEYCYNDHYPMSAMIYGAHNQGVGMIPNCYVVIKGEGHVAMVDVGYNNKDFAKEIADAFGVAAWQSPEAVMAEVGLSPEDVDTALITHAHFDHFGNVEAFPNATFYIQERELTKWVWAMSLPGQTRATFCAELNSLRSGGWFASTAWSRTSSLASIFIPRTTPILSAACGSRYETTASLHPTTHGCLPAILSTSSTISAIPARAARPTGRMFPSASPWAAMPTFSSRPTKW
ncbi:MAG: MBL fold metallo-hydrolase [Roseiarcus sp.]